MPTSAHSFLYAVVIDDYDFHSPSACEKWAVDAGYTDAGTLPYSALQHRLLPRLQSRQTSTVPLCSGIRETTLHVSQASIDVGSRAVPAVF